MPRSVAAAATPDPSWSFGSIRWGRFVFWLLVGGFFMLIALFASHQIEDFLIKDDRFRIPEADDFAVRSPNLKVQGVRYASSSQVRHVFAEDFGRSLFLVPLQKRREQLMAIDWVEEATVSKVWPNTVTVRVRERVPVAFVRLPPNRKDGMSQFALIDRDGFILRPRVASKFTLPVITGVRESEPLEDRRARVQLVLRMLTELGRLADGISEVNAADPNDLLVAERVEGGVVNLMLGEENYAERLKNFLNNYSEIRAKRPNARTLDLRVDGVITAVGGDARAEQ
jgi:cell division protein FtsQ